MKVLLFGITNVGKTTVGKILAEKLNYKFIDLDEEIKLKLKTTLEQFQKDYPFQYERHKIKGGILKEISNENDIVIAISPIYFSKNFNYLLKNPDVVSFDLQDSPENIFNRLVFSDEFDNVYEDNEYKNAHKDYYLNDIKKDITYYKRSFNKILNKYNIDGQSPEFVAEELYKIIKTQGTSD